MAISDVNHLFSNRTKKTLLMLSIIAQPRPQIIDPISDLWKLQKYSTSKILGYNVIVV